MFKIELLSTVLTGAYTQQEMGIHLRPREKWGAIFPCNDLILTPAGIILRKISVEVCAKKHNPTNKEEMQVAGVINHLFVVLIVRGFFFFNDPENEQSVNNQTYSCLISKWTLELWSIACEFCHKKQMHFGFCCDKSISECVQITRTNRMCFWLVCLYWNYIILCEVCVIEH